MQYASHGRYLAFPVADGAPLTRMRLAAADMVWLFDVQLVPPEKAGYWVYFDALYCTGQPVSLCSEAGVPEQLRPAWMCIAKMLFAQGELSCGRPRTSAIISVPPRCA